MKNSAILLFIILIFYSQLVCAQKIKSDTLYYLADTAKTPIKDRMLEIGTEIENMAYFHRIDTIKYLAIACKCLPHEAKPTFTKHQKGTLSTISKKNVSLISFTSLQELMGIVIKDYKKQFNNKHAIFIIEKIKKKYYKYQVFLTEFTDPTN